MNGRALRWGTWLLGVIVCGFIVARTTIVTDITAFLPGPATREQQLLAEQLRDGVAARVMLIGIESGTADQAPDAARVSQKMAATLAADPRFTFVANGAASQFNAERERLFAARYLISPNVSSHSFSVEGLQEALRRLESLLRSAAAPLLRPTAAQDPTGELLAIASHLKPAQGPVAAHGVWFDREQRIALLIAATRAPGFDVDAQAAAAQAVRDAFAAHGDSSLRLHLTGPGVFAAASRQAITDDAKRLTLTASIAVALLLWLVLRSPRFLLWAALPTATGALVGLAVVAVAFGSVHGVTLGFGLTLVGEAVDYAIYVQVQRQQGSNKYLWRALWLAVLTSGAGFVAMMLSGFSGLVQLGLMSIVGIATAALIARLLLPDVLRPLDVGRLASLAPLERWAAHLPKLRGVLLLLGAVSLIFLSTRGGRLWNDELAAISPLARGAGEMDARLRASLGVGDLRYVLAVEASTLNQALMRTESLHSQLEALQQRGAIAGFDSPARLVPSDATQQARRAALPDESVLRPRLQQAARGTELRAEAFEPFIADVMRAREQHIRPDYYAGTALGQRLAAQIVEREDRGAVLVTLTGVSDPAAVRTAVSAADGASLIDLTSVQTLVAQYRVRAAWAALAGGVLIIVILALQLGDRRAAARVSSSVIVAILITAALLVLIEGGLTLFHLVALLLAGGVGANYAVIAGMPREGAPPGLPVMLSIALAAATTVLAFSALALSSTPVLHMIGITVALGAPIAWLAAMAIAAPVLPQR